MVEAQCEAASTPSAVPPASPTPRIASPSPSPAAILHPWDSSSSFECQLPSSPQIMAKAPAVLIVVRHGARLDLADKHWHLTTPTPYDPPLTYGGWTQSRALGARIASILRTRETDGVDTPSSSSSAEAADSVDGGVGSEPRRRKHKIIIHTSPFLRCVQTSVAISAGLAQNPGHSHHSSSTHRPAISAAHSSPRVRPSLGTSSPSLASIPEPPADGAQKERKREKEKDIETDAEIKKSVIRVDAFLGEWLSPDYYENIMAPPGSVMMIASAKADLLRKENYSSLVQVKEVQSSASANTGFPGGWGSPVALSAADKDSDVEDGPLTSFSGFAQSLPKRDRTNSLSSAGSSGSRGAKAAAKLSIANAANHGIYQPPIPSYAISNSDQIPSGYVAHARDACVNIDYQWDSMRPPQNWGNGGEYGEEWSSMHKRFRNGLQKLVTWYKENNVDVETSKNGSAVIQDRPFADPYVEDEEDDDDTDLVVILVSHGAGCNALIGALTHQPVLMDVGMASLTMAVRKPTPRSTPRSTPGGTPSAHSRTSSRNLTVNEEYDVKLVANTEHLRPITTQAANIPSRNGSLNTYSYRQRYGSPGAFNEGITIGDKTRITSSSNFGSIRRTATIATGPKPSKSARTNSIGLWGTPTLGEDTDADEDGDDMVLNFSNDNSNAGSPILRPSKDEIGDGDKHMFTRVDKTTMEETTVAPDSPGQEAVKSPSRGGSPLSHEVVAPLARDIVTPLGLWGSPQPLGEVERTREMPKRRWTLNERGTA